MSSVELVNTVEGTQPRPPLEQSSGGKNPNLLWQLLLLLFSLGLILRLFVALYYPSVYYPDEIFQTQEPAHALVYHYGVVTWEFRAGYRSWLLPGILSLVMRASAWTAQGSQGYLTGVSVFLCLLSLSTVAFAFAWCYRAAGLVSALIGGVAAACWWELIFFAPKAFSEVVATNFLLAGTFIAVYGDGLALRRRLFFAGVLSGVAVGLRFQLAPAIGILFVYTCGRQWKQRWLPMIAGAAAVALLLGALDAYTWSFPFQSTILHVESGILGKHMGPHFSISPWSFYFVMLGRYAGPLLALAILGMRRSPLLVWMTLAIWIPHSFIAHKEYRFIYPSLPLLITLAGLGMGDVVNGVSRSIRPLRSAAAMGVLGGGIFVLSSVAYASHTQRWTSNAANLHAFKRLSTKQDVCGVGLYGVLWENSGGYTYLHQPVPLFPIESQPVLEELAPGFNYLIAESSPLPVSMAEYKRQQCWDHTCLYERAGACQQFPSREINGWLRSRNE